MRNRKRDRQAGFTLIEILVAFIILGLAAGVIMDAFGAGPVKIAQSDNERKAALAARSVLALVGGEIPLTAGLKQGTMPDGMRWTVHIQPYEATEPENGTPAPVTTPYLVSVDAALGPQAKPSVASMTTLRLKTGTQP
jgi:general secretion pathway protein I